MELFRITFKQWEKWNPRKDIKQPSWFAMSNRITEDDDIQTLSDQEFRAFVHLTCLASQKSKPPVVVNLEKAVRVTGIKRATFLETIAKLESLSVITAEHVRDPNVIRTDGVRDPNTTLQDKTRQDMTEHSTSTVEKFDFEIPYGFYPKKAGKDAGFTRLRKRITSRELFDSFTQACKAYSAECRREGKDKKFVMLFSTFVGAVGEERWRDYVQSTPPFATSAAPAQIESKGTAFSQESMASERPLSAEEIAQRRAEVAKRFGSVGA